MRKAFLLALIENTKFAWRLLYAIPCKSLLYSVVRLFLYPCAWLLITSLTLIHFFFFLLDEILFAGYRHTDTKSPIFVLGIPRSGTTWLQRVLANDSRLSTLTLTETLLTPSITQRYLLKLLALVFKPLSSALAELPFKPLKKMDAIHKIRFSEPEEDFILLLPLHACFLLTLLCPKSDHYWDLANFDTSFPDKKRRIVINFYALCVQKHLYFHMKTSGRELTFLSKNPSFTPFITTLRDKFPSAKIIACSRSPRETVPSQLNSLKPLQELLGVGMSKTEFHQKMIGLLLNYYQLLKSNIKNVHLVEMEALTGDLEQTVKKLYSQFGMVYGSELATLIPVLSEKGRKYKSEHRYDLTSYDICVDELDRAFSPYWPIAPKPS